VPSDLPQLPVCAGVSRADNPARTPRSGPVGAARPGRRSGLAGGRLWRRRAFAGADGRGATPGCGIIGCEPFVNGVAMALRPLARLRRCRQRVALHPGDARDLIEVLPDGCLTPRPVPELPRPLAEDPPSPAPLRDAGASAAACPRHARPGAEFRIATDIPDYMPAKPGPKLPRAGFTLEAIGPQPWADWFSTRYERKAIREGRVPDYATFRRDGR
jgi:tRNA (guanine-N7-)-methyltransferase